MALPENRWIQRFDNFLKVLQHLANFAAIKNGQTIAEEFAVIKAFELTFESAWNLMKDFLNSKGIIDMIGSKDTIRSAFKNGIIEDGEIWFNMIDSRNNTAHVYDEENAKKISHLILNNYVGAFRELKEKFLKYKSEAE